MFSSDRWLQFWRNYRDQPQQNAGLIELFQRLIEKAPELLTEDASWVSNFHKVQLTPEPQGMITPELMHKLTGYPASSFNDAFCKSFNAMLEATGFDKHPQAVQMLMANLMTESGNFIFMKEIASGSEYEGRSDLGNVCSGDGCRFKGCGPLQVTGRVHFEQFYEWLKVNRGIDDKRIINEGTNYVADAYPFEIAISWIDNNKLLEVCLNQGFDACCRRINGGTNGWQSRHANYQHCQQVMC
jgi:predicted chitinase